jgi:basic membrane protein A and related proteins
LLDIAPDYPKQKYFVTSFLPQPKIPSNLEFINLGYFGAAYGAGALAALISEKKQAVGFVGGEDDPTQQRIQKCFIAGARNTVPGIQGLGSSPETTTTRPKAGKPRPRWWATERM